MIHEEILAPAEHSEHSEYDPTPIEALPPEAREVFEDMYESVRHPCRLLPAHLARDAFKRMIGPEYRDPRTPGPLTEEVYDEFVDRNLPTIGIHTTENGSLWEFATVALAAQRRRAQGLPSVNVVLLQKPIYGDEFTTDHAYYVGQGTLVDAEGGVTDGPFPEPLRIDVTNGAYDHQLPLEGKVRFMNTPEQVKLTEGPKDVINKQLAEAGIPTTELLDLWTIESDPEADRLVELLQEHGRIVTKPKDGLAGRGVLMSDVETTDIDAFRERVKQQYVGQEVMVEKWADSLPINDPETQQQLDWNLRVVVGGGVVAGMYARVGEHGKPVNRATGADGWSFDKVMDAAKLGDEDREMLKRKLDTLAEKTYGVLPANFLTLDVIVGAALEPRVVEVNGESSGGLVSVDVSTGDKSKAFETADKLLQAWLDGPFSDLGTTAPVEEFDDESIVRPAIRADEVLADVFTHVERGYVTPEKARAFAEQIVDFPMLPLRIKQRAQAYLDEVA